MTRQPAEGVESVCPRCSVGCSLKYDANAGRARGVSGAPVNRRGELCPKGIGAFDTFDPDDRLTQPLIRRDGDLEPASWESAFDRIEAAFERTIDDHGPDALAFLGAPHCTNEENYTFQKLARLLGTNNVDNRARLCHDASVSAMEARLGAGGMTNSLADLGEADVFLVVGANPADQQPVAFDSYIRPAVNDGATLVHIDPRANATTRLAETHLTPRPGTDALVVSLLARAVLDEGLVDESFVDERTTGFKSFAAALAGNDPTALAERAGVSLETVREVARAFGRAERAAVVTGTGIENGPDTAETLLNLLLLTGNLGKRGTGMNVLRGLNNEQGAADAGALPHCLPGGQSLTDPAARERVGEVWGVEPPDEPGLDEQDLVRGFGNGIRAAFVLGENPAVTKLGTERVARGLESLDFLLVQDVTHTETTAHADVVLPASAWSEKSGTVTNLDRQVQRMRTLESPPGEARGDLSVLRELGERLTDGAFDDDPERLFEELVAVNPLYAGMTYEGVGNGGQRWPFPEGADEGAAVLHRERFASGDRRAPFVPVVTGTADEADAAGLVLLTGGRSGDTTNTTMGRKKRGGDDVVAVHPADADVRGLTEGDGVVVASSEGRIETTVRITESVREGCVFLHAHAADPLVGEGRTRVEVSRVTTAVDDAAD